MHALALAFAQGGAAFSLFLFLFQRAAGAFFSLAALGDVLFAARFFFGEPLALGVEALALVSLAGFAVLAVGLVALAADFLVLAGFHEGGGSRRLLVF